MKRIISILICAIMLTSCNVFSNKKDKIGFDDSGLETLPEIYNNISTNLDEIKKKEYENLKFNNFDINFPNIEEIHNIRITPFEPVSRKEFLDEFVEIAKGLSPNHQYDEDNLFIISDQLGFKDITYEDPDTGEERGWNLYPKFSDYKQDFMKNNINDALLMYECDTYGVNKNDVYALLNIPVTGQCRINKGKAARMVDSGGHLAGWQPMYVFELEAAYLTSELKDESYKLLDKEISIKDAVAFAEDFFMNKLPYETNPDIGIDIPEVHVYKVKDDVFGYCFLLRRKYGGIPFEYIMPGRARSEMSDKKEYEFDMRESFMVESDDMDFWVGSEKCQNIEHIGEPIKKILGLEAIIDIVSNKLSAGVMFNIDSVELVYSRVDEEDSDAQIANPVWKVIAINENDKLRYHTYVDAVTGELRYYTMAI